MMRQIGCVVFACVLGIDSSSAFAFRGGPPSGVNGSVASSGFTCRECHGNAVGVGSVQILGAPSAYAANTIYNISVRVADPVKLGAGFQISVEDSAGTHQGNFILTAPTLTQHNSGWVNHTETGVDNAVAGWAGNGNSATYNMQWQAPASDVGALTFWAAGNAINNNFTSSGDTIYLTNISVTFNPGPGACCDDATGVCQEGLTQVACESGGGRFGGGGTTCATIDPPCLAPTGACCDESTGDCTENQTQTVCESGGGRYGDNDSTCATIDPPCLPPPTGACCDEFRGECTDGVTEFNCEADGRHYRGDDSTCATIDPPCEISLSISLETVVSGLPSPVDLTHAGDGSGRLFIVDQGGKIHIVDAGGNLLPTPFLDVGAKIPALNAGFDERGLLGLAFHPNYASNGRFFIRYSAPRPGVAGEPCFGTSRGCHFEVLAEYKVSLVDPNLADPTSEVILFTVDKPQFNHDGGQVAFGPDGYLYWTLGDGGGAHDGLADVPPSHGPIGNGQNRFSKLGKIHRIDVDAPEWIQNPDNGHWYRLTAPAFWADAEAEAIANGGHLVTVNDSTEQAWLTTNFPLITTPYWIGLMQLPGSAEPGDGWVWVSGEPVTFVNWCCGEPNDGVTCGANCEQCAEMHHFNPGAWNDFRCSLSTQAGIIERDTEPPPYDVPPENPFADGVNGLPEIYAYGLRNPFKFSFDDGPGGDGTLWLSDVGQGLYEELNIGVLGANYGWVIREGFHCFNPFAPSVPPASCATTGDLGEPLVDPVMDYLHRRTCIVDADCAALGVGCDEALGQCENEGGISIIGGFVYRPTVLPRQIGGIVGGSLDSLIGHYVFGDFAAAFSSASGRLYYINPFIDPAKRRQFFLSPTNAALGKYLKGFGEDEDGELYVLASTALGPFGTGGVVLRVAPAFPSTPTADATGIDKCRFISFQVPPTLVDGSVETALRVNLTSLHHVDPPYTGGPTIAFTTFEGQSVWVGPPSTYIESTASQIPFMASFTQCTPHYRDWSTVGLLHVTGSAIVPSSSYHVESVAAVCQGFEGSVECASGGQNVSSQLEIRTTRWGDVEIPYNPPSTTVQPDFGDIGAMVNKFRNDPMPKARVLLTGSDAWGNITTLGVDVGFGHISACVDAFRGLVYPFRMGKCDGPPNAGFHGACIDDAECTGPGGNGAPPCNLYCP